MRAAAAGVFSLALAVLTLSGATSASAVASSAGPAPAVGSLTTDHAADPLGIDDSTPLLGWVITSAARGVSQSQYEVRVARDVSDLASGQNLVWDSGTVSSAQSFDVAYAGPALASQTRYYWQVRVRDNAGRLSSWSQPAWFETAFLDPSQFQGSWITSPTSYGGAELLLRKDFTLGSGAISRARVYVAGLSYPYLYIDGHQVSNQMLDTAFTTFSKTVDYNTFDVTHLLHPGSDALAVSLGNGFWAAGADDYPAQGGPPMLKLELDVWYANGTSTRVVTDASWQVTAGPTTSNSPAVETYDARAEKPGWTKAGYDDSGWDHAALVLDASKVPAYTGTPTADWIWNTAGATSSAPVGTIYTRKTFTVADPSSISSAVLRVNGDDGDMAYVNGTLVSSSPGTVDNSWQTSQVSDIKSLLVPGTNVIAIAGIANEANASGVIAAAQLDSTRIVTDGTWKALAGTPASPPDGWNTAGFDDSSWPAAIVQGAYGIGPWGTNVRAQAPPAGVLRAQMIPPVKQTATLAPVKTTDIASNVTVYDFGQVTSGWARITMQGTAGTQVHIQYSEQLNSNGTVQNEGGGNQADTYILKGGGPETYEPKYGWKGYQYVQVSTASGTPLPTIVSVKGVVVHTDLPAAGGFTSSSDLLNEMHTAMVNTILNNQYSYGSDTPVYEKGGWTNDNGDYAPSEMANFDAQAYYTHMMQNFDDAQKPDGNVGDLVPSAGDNDVDPLWGGSYLLIEYDMYQQYDDLSVIRRDYSNMAAYLDFMASQVKPSGYIFQGTTWGDWSVPTNGNPPSSEMIGSMFLYREAEDMAIMAAAIGNTAGQATYDSLATNILTAVNKEFYDPASHQYRDPVGLVSHARGGPNGTITSTAYDQTANVIGLEFGLAPASDRQAIANGLAANVIAQGNHLSTGANGSRYILQVLAQYGYSDLAYQVATNPTYPGWGQWFTQCGANSMWEGWGCDPRSHDHAFMGTVDDWMYADLAGIQATSPAFRTIAINPDPVGDLTSASGHETTPLGRVSSNWTRSGTSFALTVQVPVGAQASVCVPAASAESVTESGDPVGSASGVTVVGMQNSCLQVTVGSGTYRFNSTTPPSVALSLPQTLAAAGSTATVTTTLSDAGSTPVPLQNAKVALSVPSGWTATATTPSAFPVVQPGQNVQTTWAVTIPAGADPGTFPLTATATYAGGTVTGPSTMTVAYASVADAYNNVGVSDDGNPSQGNYDGTGRSFSAQALAAATPSITPGGTISHDGLTFTWPSAAPGTPDNIAAKGQTIPLSGTGTTLGIIGAGSYGAVSGTAVITYTDGTTQSFTLGFADWWTPGGDIVASAAYDNTAAGRENHITDLYYASAPLTAGKTPAFLTLPNATSGLLTMHIFSVAIG